MGLNSEGVTGSGQSIQLSFWGRTPTWVERMFPGSVLSPCRWLWSRKREWLDRPWGNGSFWVSIPSVFRNETHDCRCLSNILSVQDLMRKARGLQNRKKPLAPGSGFTSCLLTSCQIEKDRRETFILSWKQHYPFEVAKRPVSYSISCPLCLVLRRVRLTFSPWWHVTACVSIFRAS